jgi:5-methylthioribose kinase
MRLDKRAEAPRASSLPHVPAAAEIDIEDFAALRAYLGSHVGPGMPVSCRQLLGGISNRAVLVNWQDGHGWVMKQALSKLRVTVDWFCSPERIQVEAKALRWLHRLAPAGAIPALTFEDPANHILAMEAVPEDHENWKTVLLSGRVIADHFEQFGTLLGSIQRRSADAREEISQTFADNSYFVSLRLEPYYAYTGQNLPAAAAFLSALMEETLRHKIALVHGDFSPKNTLIYRDKLILLDYEVVHFGDPAFDIGFAMAHFLSKANHMPSKRNAFAEGAKRFWRAYAAQIEKMAWPGFEERSVRHSLACLLARVAGKSRLEYLTPEESSRQQAVVLSLLATPPKKINELIAAFMHLIKTHAKD